MACIFTYRLPVCKYNLDDFLMATQEQRRQATRANLLKTARELIQSNGIAGTTTRTILDAANISRGALYHHFASLEDLIAAVYEDEAKGAIERAIQKHIPCNSPMQDLLGTCLAWLDELADENVARILIIDGPVAVGWERCRNIEEGYSLRQMCAWLKQAADEGDIEIASVDLVARVLNATLSEAALSIVRSQNKKQARVIAETTFRQILAGLRPAC
jgi:AcrR family transcriptional regulator